MNHNIKKLQSDIDSCPISDCSCCGQLRLRIREQQIFDRENAPKFPPVATWTGSALNATFNGQQPYSPEAVNPDRIDAPFQSPGLGGTLYQIPVADNLCAGVDVASGPDKSVGCFVTTSAERKTYEAAAAAWKVSQENIELTQTIRTLKEHVSYNEAIIKNQNTLLKNRDSKIEQLRQDVSALKVSNDFHRSVIEDRRRVIDSLMERIGKYAKHEENLNSAIAGYRVRNTKLRADRTRAFKWINLLRNACEEAFGEAAWVVCPRVRGDIQDPLREALAETASKPTYIVT